MRSLKEIYDDYRVYGLTDEQIIEQYFVQNHIEDRGIELMSNLTKSRFQFLNRKIDYGKEHLQYCNAILEGNPKLTDQEKRILFKHAITFTYFFDLGDEAIEDCRRIFATGNVQVCPAYFVLYLIQHKVWTQGNAIDMTSFADTLDSVIYMRDN